MTENTAPAKVSKKKKIKFALFTLLFLLVILIIVSEVLLAIFHYQSSYDKLEGMELHPAKWWQCDSVSGPRYVANQLTKRDEEFFRLKNENWYYNRLKTVNNEGYFGKKDFVQLPANNDSLRILVAGDSFTWGASADIDSSYVEVFDHEINKIKPAVIWNTGIPATGTNHALFTVQKFLPLQKSNYVILGFYVGNDFGDNLIPFDDIIFYDQAFCFNYYDYDKEFKPFKISERGVVKKATGSYPMAELNFFQKILIRSRVYTFASELTDKILNRLSGRKQRANEQEYKMTKNYLKQLNDYVKSNNAELIVMVIPASDDIPKKEIHYLNVIKILKELSVNYLENIDQFSNDDYLKKGGGHWKNIGHIKAGKSLANYFLKFIEEKKKHNTP